MRLTFPLSLKVSLWLLLNLVLLGAVGLGFIVAQGGVSWTALIDGPAGERVQTLAGGIAAEAGAATGDSARDAILARFSREYGVEIFFFHNDGHQLAGPRIDLPATLRGQLIMPRGPENSPPQDAREERPPGPGRQREPSAPTKPGAADENRERGHGRFYAHTDAPPGHWICLRVPFNHANGSRPEPATLFIRIGSRWDLLRLLDLQPWLVAGAVVLVFSVAFWWPFVRGITGSLEQLSAATSRIAEGRFDTRVPEKRRDEIGALGGSVNAMAARLDSLVNGQKRFLADVAHELCSPLARLQVATSIIEERVAPDLKTAVTDVREEVEQMSALVNELLDFTRAGLRPREAALISLALPPLVARVLGREAAENRVTLALTDETSVIADAALLERALANLIRNALRYAADAGPITLRTRVENETVFITITDEGPGVSPEAISRLGEPFYRPDAARTREAGGTGLGLAIVRASVEACRGSVHFANRSPRGFSAEIRLSKGK